MPDADPNGQAPNISTVTSTPESGSRGIEAFPAEIQEHIRELRQENASRRNAEKEMRAKLKEYEDANKSEIERERTEKAELASKLTTTEIQLARYEVAAEKGVPLHLAGRLQGATKEELAADADKLKKDFGLEGAGDTGRPGFDGGVRRSVKKPKTMNELIRQGAGR